MWILGHTQINNTSLYKPKPGSEGFLENLKLSNKIFYFSASKKNKNNVGLNFFKAFIGNHWLCAHIYQYL